MANKPLKSVKFPGLGDTYTIPQVDTTLAVAGAAADSKKVGDEITELKNDLTAVETDIETGNLTAGTAEQLLADTGMTDKSPYLFRAMPTNADREEPVIVGGSVVWNQLVQNGNFADGTTGWGEPTGYTMSVSDNIMTLTYVEANSSAALMGNALGTIEGHKYLVSAQVKFDKNPAQAPFLGSGGYQGVTKNITTGSWQEISGIFERATGGNDRISFYPRGTSGAGWVSGDKVQIKDIICADLTAMFPTSVVNYVYSLEQATAGAGLAYLRKYGFFTSDYYPYSEPTFKHVEGLTAHKMVGFNQWDEVWEVGGIDNATGQNTTSSDRIRSKNYIRFLPSTVYYAQVGEMASNNFRIYFYDSNKNFIGVSPWQYSGTFTTPSNAYYGKFVKTSATTYKNDICINLSDPAKNGTYEPYTAHTYPLDTDVVLRGIPKLDANNDLYYDGDTYEADGTVTRRYEIVDLGTLNWVNNGENKVFATIANKKIGSQNIIADNFTLVPATTDTGVMTDRQIKAYADSLSITLYLTGITAANASTMLSGKYLLYELDTPTTETADPYAPLQLADPYGTEEWVLDADAFPMPVGQETFYPENLRAKIEGLPWNFANLIAPTESGYTATRAYTSGQLFIVDNVLYQATTSIASGGTITPGTNCTATTLAEVISAL